jgi:competence protein ComEA
VTDRPLADRRAAARPVPDRRPSDPRDANQPGHDDPGHDDPGHDDPGHDDPADWFGVASGATTDVRRRQQHHRRTDDTERSGRPTLLRPPPPRSARERALDWVRWVGVGRVLGGAVSIVTVAVGAWWMLRPPAPPVEANLPIAVTPIGSTAAAATGVGSAGEVVGDPAPSTASEETATSVPVDDSGAVTVVATDVVVHVAGAVAAPGVHRVPLGARVIDAVNAAGGALDGARTELINLASPLTDGDRVYVPYADDDGVVAMGITPSPATAPSGGPSGAGPAQAASGPVDLNEATAEQLDALPGIGPSTAAAIVAHRDANGPFPSVDALGDVRGIGPAKLEALRPMVQV